MKTRNPDHRTNRSLSDKLMPQVKHILADLGTVSDPSSMEDKAEATDLWLQLKTRPKPLRVGVRIQRQTYRYLQDATISINKRYGPQNSGEWKVLFEDALVDLYVFGYADKAERKVDQYALVHLPTLRKAIKREGADALFSGIKSNGRDTEFRKITLEKLRQHHCILMERTWA